jgi:hypothetical protein
MKTMTIRDLRQRWPEAEAALAMKMRSLLLAIPNRWLDWFEFPRVPCRDVGGMPKAHAQWQKKVSAKKSRRATQRCPKPDPNEPMAAVSGKARRHAQL